MSMERLSWWSNLRHGGLLLDMPRLSALVPEDLAGLSDYDQDRLRRRLTQFHDDPAAHRGELVSFVLEATCGFARPQGEWYRAGNVKAEWSRRAITGESVRPRHLWIGANGAILPVFIDEQPRLGVGKGRRVISQVLGWLRHGKEQLALVTNGQEWRLVFAGLDYDAFCQWEVDAWFAEGKAAPELNGFRALFAPPLWTPEKDGEACPLLAAINNSRKGQADLSQILGERVRQAAELLIQAHTPALKDHMDGLAPQDIYRAAVRMVMRLVVVLFAESREGLLARDNRIFRDAYSLQSLREQLERISNYKLTNGVGAYPRILALLRLVYEGSSHSELSIPAYGGELFAPGRADDPDGMKRALHMLETACFGQHQAVIMTDWHVRQILDLLTRTKLRIRQGRTTLLVPSPVDFSSLDSEYIGILYEGLLDFELRCASENEPIVFLAVGNQPALPLTTLLAMDDRAIKNLLEKFKDTSSGDEDEESQADEGEDTAEGTAELDEAEHAEDSTEELDESTSEEVAPQLAADDPRYSLRQRAEEWAIRACRVGNLVARPRSRSTPETQMRYEQALTSKARQLVVKVVLPGEWYLVRWGGTRKGSGTFYTRPQLAIPTVHRTLRPLAYEPPAGANGEPDTNAPVKDWTPKTPEAILSLKVCDPACGSGSFPLAALRFLTNALYESLVVHGRIREHGGRAVLDLIHDEQSRPALSDESLPCRPEDDEFEPQTRALLRRYVVERCIYGVDIDPLAVELCRLSLWIETLNPRLPLTFLNHKIKCGNSLVGAWFDQFLHYPTMAWEREGGDKNHTNGVHFVKEARTKAIKTVKARVKPDLIKFIDGGGFKSMYPIDLATVKTGHDTAEAALQEIHAMGITDVERRAARYETMLASDEYQALKAAFDLWCALWFWTADQLEHAPLPTQFAAMELSDVAWETVRQTAREQRFFHWELEFPDVFSNRSRGFHAVLGNPPWDISKPNSKEFFSAYDPLYRSYGKQEALARQHAGFEEDPRLEEKWLAYCARFKAMGNWVKFAGHPFGDRVTVDKQGKESHDFNLGDRGRSTFATSQRRHDRWRAKREQTSGYADTEHSFRHQGSADVNLYKLFLEQAHALLADNGRLGLIVPSGLYSDFGTGELRRLFVDRCRWHWLFGFENREGIFDIHRSFKFNPVIVEKGGQTEAIRTAFMRRELGDWEQGETFATDYTREQVVQFSPNSRAILEIQSQRDLEVLTKIYSNSVLLGDQSERGWGIKYTTEFHMTNDSKLFPPRPKWEEWGYRPDEYSRWIKGPWKPIEDLYAELGVKPLPEGERRCAQPPYDCLALPRADIPPGVILSREATHFIRENEIPDVVFTDANGRPLRRKLDSEDGEVEEAEVKGPAIALPLYQGIMVNQLELNVRSHQRGTGYQAVWSHTPLQLRSAVDPQYLMGSSTYGGDLSRFRISYRRIARTTDSRTWIGCPSPGIPCGDSIFLLCPSNHAMSIRLAGFLATFWYDWSVRQRLGGTNLSWFVMAETAICAIPESIAPFLEQHTLACVGPLRQYAMAWLRMQKQSTVKQPWATLTAATDHERVRRLCALNAISALLAGLTTDNVRHVLMNCDLSTDFLGSFSHTLDSRGFWRIDKEKCPEHRQTILSFMAFQDLRETISACNGNVVDGIERFSSQNNGEGWMLPETLRLADYGLGRDDRALEHHPVRECFGPRFYDWQLAQSAEESWRECHLHARNLLGADGYQSLLDQIEVRTSPTPPTPPPESKRMVRDGQGKLFETEELPLFDSKE